MKKEEFMKMFVVQFLASWAAKNYDEYCSLGIQEQLEKPPVEDAVFLAEKAWKKLDEFIAL